MSLHPVSGEKAGSLQRSMANCPQHQWGCRQVDALAGLEQKLLQTEHPLNSSASDKLKGLTSGHKPPVLGLPCLFQRELTVSLIAVGSRALGVR